MKDGTVRTHLDDFRRVASADDGRHVIVDFDLTLFLQNSTELFLMSAKPKFLVFLIVGMATIIVKLARLVANIPPRSADYFSVIAIILLMPWNYWRWKREARRLFDGGENRDLADGLRTVPNARIVICSNGYDALIRPLIEGTRWARCQLSLVPLFRGGRVLRQDKIERLSGVLAERDIDESVFITDSEDDRQLLARARFPYLVVWTPNPERYSYIPWYMPLSYTFFGKFTWSYCIDQIIFVDYAIMFLALVFSAAGNSVAAMAGAACLLLSLHSIYEIGYYKNDFDASKLEAVPHVRPEAARFRDRHVVPRAFLYSLLFGGVGCWLLSVRSASDLRVYDDRLLLSALCWASVLGILYAVFSLYNRLKPQHRIAVYPCLQTIRFFSVYILVLPAVPGLILAASQVAMTSSRYICYRMKGNVVDFPSDAVRANFFLVSALAFCLLNRATLTAYDVVAFSTMLAWSLFRAVFQRHRNKRASRNKLAKAP